MQPERHIARLAERDLPPRANMRAAPAAPAVSREPERPCHDARLLTGGGNEAEIRLDGVRYVLRITRQGKLILTK
jgi:hemin uptake protein HemP